MTDPVPSKDLCSQLRALPAGHRLLGYTAAEEIKELRSALRDARWYIEQYDPKDVSEAHDRDLLLTSMEALGHVGVAPEPGTCCYGGRKLRSDCASCAGWKADAKPAAVPPHFKLMSNKELCEFLHVAAAFRKLDKNSDAELMEEAACRLTQPPRDGQ